MSCLLITLIKRLKGHKSLGSLCSVVFCMSISQVLSEWVSEWQGHLLSCSGQLKNENCHLRQDWWKKTVSLSEGCWALWWKIYAENKERLFGLKKDIVLHWTDNCTVEVWQAILGFAKTWEGWGGAANRIDRLNDLTTRQCLTDTARQ